MAEPAPTRERRALLRGWRGAIVAGVGVLAVGGAVLIAPRLSRDPFSDDIAIAFVEADRFSEIASYEGSGLYALGYDHGRTARFSFPLRNETGTDVRVTAIDPLPGDYRLLVAEQIQVTGPDGLPVTVPFTLGAGDVAQVDVTARFDNCRYTHERAIHSFPHARVTTEVFGLTRTREVGYARTLAVRTPTIVDCPGRKLARAHRTPPPTPSEQAR